MKKKLSNLLCVFWKYLFFVSMAFFVGETQLEELYLLLLFYATDSWLRNISSKHTMGSINFLIFRKQCTMIWASKVNSVQEACAKCFLVHILKFEILQITWKKLNKEHQTLSFQFFTNKFSILMFLFCFFMWFARFQILLSEPQSIWRKLLVLSWL